MPLKATGPVTAVQREQENELGPHANTHEGRMRAVPKPVTTAIEGSTEAAHRGVTLASTPERRLIPYRPSKNPSQQHALTGRQLAMAQQLQRDNIIQHVGTSKALTARQAARRDKAPAIQHRPVKMLKGACKNPENR